MAIIDKNIRIYYNGVWVDFSLVNGRFFTTEGTTKLFTNARFFNGVDWCIPRTRAQTWDLLIHYDNQLDVTYESIGSLISKKYEKTFDGILELVNNDNPTKVGCFTITDQTIVFQKFSTGIWEAFFEFSAGSDANIMVRIYNT